ncbi:MAG: hypothetical protein K2M13_00405 [Muribaculaceae bacterium]|nr:hypothetical protein [Muribaculaceae bacterium]
METMISVATKLSDRKSYGMGLCFLLFTFMLISCHANKEKAEEPAKDSIAYVIDDSYHADNDIGMTVRSVIDALHQEEELNGEDYDFTGILTDGAGHPLYTDLTGTPGEWEVKVVSPAKLVIYNKALGDLLPQALEMYIAQCLMIDNNNIISENNSFLEDGENVHIYEFEGGFLTYKNRTQEDSKGEERSVVTIIASKTLPVSYTGNDPDQ